MTTGHIIALGGFGHLGGFHSGGRGIGSILVHLALWHFLGRLFVDYPAVAWPVAGAIVVALIVRYVVRQRRFRRRF